MFFGEPLLLGPSQTQPSSAPHPENKPVSGRRERGSWVLQRTN